MDPDQLASEKPADLDLHCFQIRIFLGSVWLRVQDHFLMIWLDFETDLIYFQGYWSYFINIRIKLVNIWTINTFIIYMNALIA